MKFNKPYFIASTSNEAREQKDLLVSKYGDFAVNDADIFIVLGGDGFMLQAIKDFMDKKIPFFGINYGSIGFLMNSVTDDDLIIRVNEAQSVQLSPLVMTAYDKDDSFHTAKAINEVSLLRERYQAAKVKIYVDGKERLKELICDGLLLSTPAGSTAYNLSAHGPILPLTSNLLALTPISAFRPRRWKGALLPRNAKVRINILEKNKRPVSVVADNSEFRDIDYVEISEDKDIQLKMLFDPKTNLEERIINEQFIY